MKTFGSSNQVKITTSYLIEKGGDEAEKQVEGKLMNGLSTIGDNTGKILSQQKVGPTIADDIKTSAVWAILLSLAAVFFYIYIRFKRWQFGMGAMVALLHDVLILLSLFSIFNGILPFSLDIDQQFIAAVLTVMGYSMNDTVIVYDRIREDSVLMKGSDNGIIINRAINQTLSRTIMTSVTVFLTILILFIFGGEVTRGFAFAMLIGVIVGSYSSIFVAAPVLVDFAKNKPLGRDEKKKK